MPISMPAAVLAGGASHRMGRPKGALPYGAGTLLEYQTSRLARLFEEVWVVAKERPEHPIGPARLLLDRTPPHAAIHGLTRALEEASDRVFLLAVDLPALPAAVIREIALRGARTGAAAVLPLAEGRPQPLAAVWTRRALPEALARISRGELSLHGLADAVGAESILKADWRALDPSGDAFVNLNTLEQYAAHRERA